MIDLSNILEKAASSVRSSATNPSGQSVQKKATSNRPSFTKIKNEATRPEERFINPERQKRVYDTPAIPSWDKKMVDRSNVLTVDPETEEAPQRPSSLLGATHALLGETDPSTVPFDKDRVAWGYAQGQTPSTTTFLGNDEDISRYPSSYKALTPGEAENEHFKQVKGNPLGLAALDILAINQEITDARRSSAQEKAEYSYRIDGKPYSQADIDGTLSNPDGTISMPDGTVYPSSYLAYTEDGGKVTAEQTNPGLFNIDKVDPSAPWEDPKDIAPWFVDVASGSAPWLVPGWREATMTANAAPAIHGFDPNTFDRESFTFANTPISQSQQVGLVSSPLVERYSESLGGIKKFGKLDEMFGGAGRLKNTGLYQNLSPKAQRALDLVGVANSEGLEEVLVTPFEELGNTGFGDMFKEPLYKSDGTEYMPTSPQRRLENAAENAADAYLGGALFGGVLGAGNTIREGRNAKKAEKAKKEADRKFVGAPSSQLDAIASILNQYDNRGEN